MPKYRFAAENEQGFTISGEVSADSHDQAMAQLRKGGLTVRQIDRAGSADAVRLSADEVAFFNQQLADLAGANLPLPPALRELAGDIGAGRLASVLRRLADDLSAGKSLPDAIAAQGRSFPPLYAQMIQAGMRSGNLAGVLAAMARHESIIQRLRRSVLEAITYPLIVLAWAIVMLLVLSHLVLPGMWELTDQIDIQQSSGQTQGQLAMLEAHPSHPIPRLLAQNSHWIILAAACAGLLAWVAFRSLKFRGVRLSTRLAWRLPLIGRVCRDAARAQLCDLLAMSLATGQDIAVAMELAGQSLSANPIRPEALAAAELYRQGGLSAESADRFAHLPRLVTWSVEVAGPRGDLAATLRRVAAMYGEGCESSARFVRLILAPLSILLIGAVVMLAMVMSFLPLIQLIRTVSGGTM